MNLTVLHEEDCILPPGAAQCDESRSITVYDSEVRLLVLEAGGAAADLEEGGARVFEVVSLALCGPPVLDASISFCSTSPTCMGKSRW